MAWQKKGASGPVKSWGKGRGREQPNLQTAAGKEGAESQKTKVCTKPCLSNLA